MNWLRKLWHRDEPKAAAVSPAPEAPPEIPQEPVAFISDIHGNLQALQAVMADIEAQGVREVICLGDLVGYGGNPAECVKLIRAAGIPSVRGNHDAYADDTAALPEGRSDDFEQTCRWMRAQVRAEGCHWLANLPMTLVGDDFEAVHCSLHNPEQWPYMLIASHAESHFSHQTKPVSFVGHTHQPRMWVQGMEEPLVTSFEILRPDRKQVVNVGAVGQPRDGDPRACYVIYRRKEREIRWRRVPYDIAGAQEAIAKAGLPGKYAGRLEVGK